jgi:hypothetical protein
VSPRRTKSFKWTVNIEHATLEGLKNSIRAMYQTPALENDGAELNMLNESGKYSPRNDQDLREVLRILVSKNNLEFHVFIETPSKASSDWTFSSVCHLYGLGGETEDPTMAVFPVFSCGSVKPSQESFENLMTELNPVSTTLLSIYYQSKPRNQYTSFIPACWSEQFQGKV